MNLIAELRRHKVFKVGAAYLVVGWLLIQVAATVGPQLNLPAWALRFITFARNNGLLELRDHFGPPDGCRRNAAGAYIFD